MTSALTAASGETVIQWHNERQVIEGFGGSSAWFADNLMALPAAKRAQIIRTLFDTETGIGCSILRLRIEPRAFSAATRQWDWTNDKVAAQAAVVRQARAHGLTTVVASPWTPPACMKDNDSRFNGSLRREDYGAYARALSQYVTGMKARHGVTIDVLSLQNEADEHKRWESCKWTCEDMITFLKDHLGPRLNEDGVDVRVMANEHTMWDKHFKTWMTRMLADPAASRHLDIVAGHRYRQPAASPFPAAKKNDKALWMSEYYYEGDGNRALNNARIVHNFMVRAEANAYLFWWLVSRPNKTRQSLIQIDADKQTFKVSRKAYAFGNYARFVRPGYRRLALRGNALADGVLASAYKDPETGAFAVVVINCGRTRQGIVLGLDGFTATAVVPYRTSKAQALACLAAIQTRDGSSFADELPPESVTTYTGTGQAGRQ